MNICIYICSYVCFGNRGFTSTCQAFRKNFEDLNAQVYKCTYVQYIFMFMFNGAFSLAAWQQNI